LCADPARAAREAALEAGDYGRCVFHCDNDVADHQVVAVEFDGGLTATLGVHGTASEEQRTLRISGSVGELRGVLQTGVIELSRHGSLEREEIRIEKSAFGHSGGDQGLLDHFCEVVAIGAPERVRASGRVALSHLLGFAASRAAERRVIDMQSYRDEVRRGGPDEARLPLLGQLAAVGPDGRELLGRNGTAEQVALHADAAELEQEVPLLDRLHTLGDDVEPELAGEREHRARDRGATRFARDVAHERLVDLEPVRGNWPSTADSSSRCRSRRSRVDAHAAQAAQRPASAAGRPSARSQ
jgi:hypothetical protein